ncbi:MAG: hypothetical protein AABZ74_15470 [Cyanobacteriota bacterium]
MIEKIESQEANLENILNNIIKEKNLDVSSISSNFFIILNNNPEINEINQKIDLLLDKVSNLENKKNLPKPKKFNWKAVKQLRESFKDEVVSEESIIKLT